MIFHKSHHQLYKITDLYADDTSIIDISFSKDVVQQNLQHSLDTIETWCKENGMVLEI